MTKSEVTPKARAPSAGRAEPEQSAGKDLVAPLVAKTSEPVSRPARPRSDRFNQ